jgi:hypothetical protein
MRRTTRKPTRASLLSHRNGSKHASFSLVICAVPTEPTVKPRSRNPKLIRQYHPRWPRPAPPAPHLRRDGAHPCHICTGTAATARCGRPGCDTRSSLPRLSGSGAIRVLRALGVLRVLMVIGYPALRGGDIDGLNAAARLSVPHPRRQSTAVRQAPRDRAGVASTTWRRRGA